jgi:hypothetical protein
MNISVGGYLFILKFDIRFYFILFICLQDIRGEKNINVNWTRWITNWRIMELMNIEKKRVHPLSIHPSMMVQWLLIFGQKTLVFVNPPPSSFLHKIWKFFMHGKRMVWMANAYVDGKFPSLPSRIYHGCMLNLPCSMDLWGFCAWVHPYHGEFSTMDGPMHTASQVLTTFTTTKLNVW